MAMAMAMAASSAMALPSATPPPPLPSFSSTPPPLVPKQIRFSTPISPVSISSSCHDPSLAFANLLWFKGSYNAQIFVGENEPPDSVVRRFRRAVSQAGVIPECRRRRFHETPQDIVKRKQRANALRKKTRRYIPRPFNDQSKPPLKAVVEDDDDNWEYDGVADGLSQSE